MPNILDALVNAELADEITDTVIRLAKTEPDIALRRASTVAACTAVLVMMNAEEEEVAEMMEEFGEKLDGSGPLDDAEATSYDFIYLDPVIGGRGTGRLANYNDAPGRTQEEVLALFDRAIRRAETTEPEEVTP